LVARSRVRSLSTECDGRNEVGRFRLIFTFRLQTELVACRSEFVTADAAGRCC
jgi:hypothetical protein